MNEDGVSIIIPACNEAKNLPATLASVRQAARDLDCDYEILIVNDGSRDETAAVAEALAKKDPHIRIVTHPKNLGIGTAFQSGLRAAQMPYVSGFPGDNDMSIEGLKILLQERKSADLISSYMENPQARSVHRRLLSKSFVLLMNFLFGTRLKYYTGYFTAPRAVLQSTQCLSTGFTFFAEIKIRMMREGKTVKEVPFHHTSRAHGKSRAATLKGILNAAWGTTRLVWDILCLNFFSRWLPFYSQR